MKYRVGFWLLVCLWMSPAWGAPSSALRVKLVCNARDAQGHNQGKHSFTLTPARHKSVMVPLPGGVTLQVSSPVDTADRVEVVYYVVDGSDRYGPTRASLSPDDDPVQNTFYLGTTTLTVELAAAPPLVAAPAGPPMQPCPDCDGTGKCPACDGTGKIACKACGGSGKCAICGGSGYCPQCGGTGTVNGYPCVACNGTGVCAVCNGSGHCVACNGKGYTRICPVCGGSGACQTCGGTGQVPLTPPSPKKKKSSH